MGAAESVRYGHRVVEVAPGSPAAEAGLVPFFDFVVAVNALPLDGAYRCTPCRVSALVRVMPPSGPADDRNTLVRHVYECIGSPCTLRVFNVKVCSCGGANARVLAFA